MIKITEYFAAAYEAFKLRPTQRKDGGIQCVLSKDPDGHQKSEVNHRDGFFTVEQSGSLASGFQTTTISGIVPNKDPEHPTQFVYLTKMIGDDGTGKLGVSYSGYYVPNPEENPKKWDVSDFNISEALVEEAKANGDDAYQDAAAELAGAKNAFNYVETSIMNLGVGGYLPSEFGLDGHEM